MAIVSFEFIISGSPFSVNLARKQTKKHNKWKELVGLAAKKQWKKDGRAEDILPLDQPMEVEITTYFTALAKDVDNPIKPILDGLSGIIYVDDRVIYKVTSLRVDLNSFTVTDSPSPLLIASLGVAQEMVHITLIWEQSEE